MFFLGTQAFFLNWPSITMSFIDWRYTVSCVHLGMFQAFANKLDFFHTNLTGGFVESFPDMIFHYCKSFTPLIFVGRGSERTAYED